MWTTGAPTVPSGSSGAISTAGSAVVYALKTAPAGVRATAGGTYAFDRGAASMDRAIVQVTDPTGARSRIGGPETTPASPPTSSAPASGGSAASAASMASAGAASEDPRGRSSAQAASPAARPKKQRVRRIAGHAAIAIPEPRTWSPARRASDFHDLRAEALRTVTDGAPTGERDPQSRAARRSSRERSPGSRGTREGAGPALGCPAGPARIRSRRGRVEGVAVEGAPAGSASAAGPVGGARNGPAVGRGGPGRRRRARRPRRAAPGAHDLRREELR